MSLIPLRYLRLALHIQWNRAKFAAKFGDLLHACHITHAGSTMATNLSQRG